MAHPKSHPLNLHAAKNGAKISRLTLGELPTRMKRQLASARRYRRDLEAAVADVKGEVDLVDAHIVDECCGAETHASVCRWLLREKLDEMSPSDIIKCSEQILKSRTIRNRAVEQLGLKGQERDVVAVLYAEEPDRPPTSARVAEEGDRPTDDTSPPSRPTRGDSGADPEEGD